MTPVQIPFKRNFKDMENKFEYLKIDGREQLPAPWSDYPVLREYETVTVYRNGRDYLDALVGQQDGWCPFVGTRQDALPRETAGCRTAGRT